MKMDDAALLHPTVRKKKKTSETRGLCSTDGPVEPSPPFYAMNWRIKKETLEPLLSLTWRDKHLSDTYFEFLVWPLSIQLTWRGRLYCSWPPGGAHDILATPLVSYQQLFSRLQVLQTLEILQMIITLLHD